MQMYDAAGVARRDRHRLDVVAAVRGGGVHVHVAPQVRERDEPRQAPGLGGVDLAAGLAQRRIDARQAERGVDAVLGLAGDAGPGGGVGEGVLVQRVAARQGALPQLDVVRLRSGEVLQRRAARFGRHQPQVGLHLAGQQDAGLGVAEAEHALDLPVAGEVAEDVGRRVGGQDVDVAAGLGAAAQAADDVVGGVGRRLAQPGDQRLRRLAGVADQVTPGVLAALGDRRQDQAFLLRAHALEAADGAGLGRGFEVVERADVQRVVEQRHRLRPDALQAHHLEDRGGEQLQQLVAQAGGARGGDVADARGQVLADAVDRQQRRRRRGRRRERGSRRRPAPPCGRRARGRCSRPSAPAGRRSR